MFWPVAKIDAAERVRGVLELQFAAAGCRYSAPYVPLLTARSTAACCIDALGAAGGVVDRRAKLVAALFSLNRYYGWQTTSALEPPELLAELCYLW